MLADLSDFPIKLMLADLSDLSDSYSHIRIPLRFDFITFWYIPTEAFK
jgi:hypothetical protein